MSKPLYHMRLLLVIVLCLQGALALGNDLRTRNLTYDLTAQTVTFELSWKNSWRVALQPANWDAAWVFVKFRQCGVDPNTVWEHGTLNYAGSTIPAALQAVDANNNVGFYTDNLGAMLRRSAEGIYPDAGWHTITLNVTNLPAPGTDVDVKVFGLEMVYVPQGGFWLGDGTNTTWYAKVLPPVYINSEAFASAISFGHPCQAVANNVTLPAAFPKGFAAFYVMKYEITHGQYVDFLNTLASSQHAARFPGLTPGGGFACGNQRRYDIVNTGTPPNIYVTQRPDRALNWISWADITGYLDWAALRPITEFEFEKACRGPQPHIPNEYAWGTTNITRGSIFNGSENGTEQFLDVGANCNFGGAINFAGSGDGCYGPVRAGIFARPTSPGREASGATYYGIMEMSGNLWEYVVPASANASGMTRVWGNGYLTATGEHNVATWPAANVTAISGCNVHVGLKGGSWENGADASLHVSGRTHMGNTSHVSRHWAVGGRGGR